MSTQKFKKGFTLIELMVVIVIIGILAAIAIPKLFGMTAKAKAQEIGPAAGTWSKLQTAYVLEKGSPGSFVDISYIPPGGDPNSFTCQTNPDYDSTDDDSSPCLNSGVPSSTPNFTYEGTTSGTGPTAAASWQASMNTGLGNGCDELAHGIWKAEHDITFNGGIIPKMTNALNACGALTPNFEAIGKKQ